MSHPPKIVVLGRDPGLLQTRSWVLELAGFEVQTAQNLPDAEHLIDIMQPGLLVICHSLPPEQCREAVNLVHEGHPHTRLILMSSGSQPCSSGEQDRVVSSFDGPRALIAAAKAILGSSLSKVEVPQSVG